MLRDRVKCAVANPGGPIGVGSVVTLGAAPVGFRSFLAAFGAAQPAYFVLSDGAGKALGGIWTVNGDGTATITAILINDATGGTGSETFASACTAWCAMPAASFGGQFSAAAAAAAARATLGATATGSAVFTAADAAAARATLGATATGGAVFTAADAAAARTAIGAANIAGQTFTGAVATSTGDITAQAGILRSQISGAATTGQVVLGNGAARLHYNGSQFDLNAHLSVPVVRGGSGDAGTLRTFGAGSSVNFRWDASHLLYRVDEVIERAIMFSPTNSAAVSQWRGMGDITPTGGTWAYFVIGFNATGHPVSHTAGVAAGDTTVMTGLNAYTGFAWRIA